MKRIAILADVHGNLPALEAVIDDLAKQDVDEVIAGGDLVGRGPEGSGVARRVRELGWPAIGGNHEEYLLEARRGEVPAGWHEKEIWAASRFMSRELDDDVVAYLEALPTTLARPGLRLVHGTPGSNRRGIGSWTRDDELAEHLAAVDEELLVCAHTHRPLVRRQGGRLVVNVGSVGLPFDGDPRARYAIFERAGDASGWSVEHRHVVYDRERIYAVYESSGFLEHGGVSARLLRFELEHATPALVPFQRWAEVAGVEPTSARLDDFLRFFQPDEPPGTFWRRLQTLAATVR